MADGQFPGLALVPINLLLRDMRTRNTDQHPVANLGISHDNPAQLAVFRVQVQDDPGLVVEGLHLGHLGGHPQQINLADFNHRSME